MSNYTPGPWEVAGYNGHDFTHEVTTAVRPSSERELIASVVAYPHPPRSEEAEANARLISAAPELLAVCKALLRAPSACSAGQGSVTLLIQNFHLRDAAAAIAKAEGQEVPHA